MSYPKIIKEAALEKMFHTDLSLRHISDELLTKFIEPGEGGMTSDTTNIVFSGKYGHSFAFSRYY